MTTETRAYAAHAADKPLEQWRFDRRDPRPDDVSIEILYCGVCHSDLHFARNDWGFSEYPIVPGHEIVGRVTHVGPEVTHYAEGDLVGVGCMVDSCRECEACNDGLEQYCLNGFTMTYGTIGSARSYADEERGDASDADALYSLLEREVVPLYYERQALQGASEGSAPLPLEWLRRAANAVASVTPEFNAQRMVKDYVERYYLPASGRSVAIGADDYALARSLALWREKVATLWEHVALRDVEVEQAAAQSDEPVAVAASLTAPGFGGDELVVELVYSREDDDLATNLRVVALERQEVGASDPADVVRYAARFTPALSGRLVYGLRCYPVHEGLTSQADAHAVTWAVG